jgi:hypothetical protein
MFRFQNEKLGIYHFGWNKGFLFCLLKMNINKEFCCLEYNAVNSLKVNGRFRGKRRLHLQARRIYQAGNKHEEDSKYVPPKRRLVYNGLHVITSQKTELFITTIVRTSNPVRTSFIPVHQRKSNKLYCWSWLREYLVLWFRNFTPCALHTNHEPVEARVCFPFVRMEKPRNRLIPHPDSPTACL